MARVGLAAGGKALRGIFKVRLLGDGGVKMLQTGGKGLRDVFVLTRQCE